MTGTRCIGRLGWLGLAILFAGGAKGPDDHTVRWAGRTWVIRDDTGGPGPNRFAAGNVEVRADGTLHLFVRQVDGAWTCGELSTTEPLGPGTYTFDVATAVDQFDPSVVLGLFSYPEPDVGPDGTNELDIEFARWGHAEWPNGNYTAYPSSAGKKEVSQTFEFHQPNDGGTLQRYHWQRQSVAFETSTAGRQPRLLHRWGTPEKFGPQVAKEPMPVHLNLWLFGGRPPTDGKPVEVVVRAFTFTAGT